MDDMDEGKTLFRTVGIDKWGKIIAHKGKGYQLDYTGWESMEMKVFPRRKGDPTEEWPISRNPENLKYTEDSQGVLEFSKPPKVSESGTSIDFTVEVTEKKDKLAPLMPKLKAREAIYHMNMEIELDLKLKASGATVSLDTMRAAMRQAIGATVPGPMAGIAQSFVSPKVRDKCNFYIQFPPPYIWHPFLQDDKLAQPNANRPSRNDPKYLASQDQERGAYILDTTTDEYTTCAAELRKFNPDNQLYRVTDEVMDFNFNTIAHQDILQTDGPRDHCGFTLRTHRALLGRPREPNEMACKVVMKRKKEFSNFPESPARNDGEECAVFYKWVEQVTIQFVLHFTDESGKKTELFSGTRPIKHEQFEIGFKVPSLDAKQTIQLEWSIAEGHPRIMKEGSLFTKKGEETLGCSGDQTWKTKISLVTNPVNEGPLILIPVEFQLKAEKLMLLVNKQGWAGSRMTLSRDIADHQQIYEQISTGKAYFEIKIPNPYLDEFGSDRPGLRDEFWAKQVLFPEIEFYKDLELFGKIITEDDGRTYLSCGESEDQGTVLEFKSDEVANNYKGSLKLDENVLKLYEDLKYGFEKLALVADKIKPGEKELVENQFRKYRPEFFKFYLKEKSPFVKDYSKQHEGAAKCVVGMVKYSIPQPRILLDLVEMHNRAISDAFGAALNVIIDFAFFGFSFVGWFRNALSPAVQAAAAREAAEGGIQQVSREAGEQAARTGGGTAVGEGTEAATRTTVGEATEAVSRQSGEQATQTSARELGPDAAEAGLHPDRVSGRNVISYDSLFGETAEGGARTAVGEGTEAATRTTVSEAGEQAARTGGGTVVGEGTEAATRTTIQEAGEKGAQQTASSSVRAMEAQVRQLQRELAEAQSKIATAKGTETTLQKQLIEVSEKLAHFGREIGKWNNARKKADELIDVFNRIIEREKGNISALRAELATAAGNRKGTIQESIQQITERVQRTSARLAEAQAKRNDIIDNMLQDEIAEHGLKTHEKTLTDQLADAVKKIGDEREHVRELQYQMSNAVENLENARRAIPPIGMEPPPPRIPPTGPPQAAGLPGTGAQPSSGGTWAEIADWLSKAINAIKRFAVWLSSNLVQPLFGEKSRFSQGFTGSLIQWLMDYEAKGVVSEPLNPSMDWINPSLAENNEAYMNKDFRDKEKTRLLNKALQEIENSKKNIPWKFCECLESNLAMAVDLAIERKFGDRGEKVEDRCKKFTYNFIHLIKEEYKAEYRSTSYLGWNPRTIGNVLETWRDLEHALDYILFFVSWGIRVKAVLAAPITGGISLAALAIADFVDLVKSSLVLLMSSLGDSLSKAKMAVAVTNYPALVLAWIKGADDEEKCENLPFHLNSFSEWASHLKETFSQDRIRDVLALKAMNIPWAVRIIDLQSRLLKKLPF